MNRWKIFLPLLAAAALLAPDAASAQSVEEFYRGKTLNVIASQLTVTTQPIPQQHAILGTPVIVGGVITSIPVLNGGAGYTSPPAVTITGGRPTTAATAIAVLALTTKPTLRG